MLALDPWEMLLQYLFQEMRKPGFHVDLLEFEGADFRIILF